MSSGTRQRIKLRPLIGAALLLMLVGASALLLLVSPGSRHPARVTRPAAPTIAPTATVTAIDYRRSHIYHSPQSPGFTSWVGAWLTPDGRPMVAFDQATGPVNPARRRLMPERLLERSFGMTEDPRDTRHFVYLDPNRDMWGLNQEVVTLAPGAGTSWRIWRVDPFHALDAQAFTPQADVALSDGVLLRRISGSDLANDPHVPHQALVESLSLNRDDGGRTARWSKPMMTLHDPGVCTDGISRIRQLPDGRVIAMGGVWGYARGDAGPCATTPFSLLLLVAQSAADAVLGRWQLGMPFTNALAPDEWDAVELPNGNLLALFRTEVDGRPVRRLAILHRELQGWKMGTPYTPPPLPAFEPSGHPELLATKQGAVISFATTGAAYTVDGGRTWRTLPFAGEPAGFSYTTDYYPRAVQARDGTIYVFSSDGWDIPYGGFNESIVMDSFRLRVS